jgi:hypothetical protein
VACLEALQDDEETLKGNNAMLPIGKSNGLNISPGHNRRKPLPSTRHDDAAALLFSARPVLAQFQVPGECTELAAREGFPTTTLTKYQATRARARMALLCCHTSHTLLLVALLAMY